MPRRFSQEAQGVHPWMGRLFRTIVNGEIRPKGRRMVEASHQADLLETVEESLDALQGPPCSGHRG